MDREAILSRPIKELVWKLSPPGIVGMLMTSINAMADAIFAGQFIGSAAMAGIALSIPFILFNFAIVRLVGMGSASIVSRALGSGSKKILGSILYYSIALLVLFSVFISISGYFFAENIIRLIGGSGEVLQYGAQYYLVMSVFSLPSILGVGTSILIRSEGKVFFAMKITMIGVILNLILCPLFSGYFKWGVTGIGLATVLAMSVYSVLTVYYFISGKSNLFFGKFPQKIDFGMIRNIFSVGLPGFLNQLSGLVRQIFLFNLIAIHQSETSLVIFSAIYRTFSFSVTPALGIVQALQPVVGINYGAGKFKRVKEAYSVFLKYSIILMAFLAFPLLIFSENVLMLLISDFPITEIDLFYFRILISIMFIFPVFPTTITFLQAIGKQKIASYMMIGRDLLLFYPIIALCWIIGTTTSLYYGVLIENIICFLLFMVVMYLVLKDKKYQSPL
nr:MATE family efflux transporter [uncultured Chryseobacterium sp.]